MRRLFVSMIVSLDGYIEGAERELDWFEDGDPQFEQYCDEMIDSVRLAGASLVSTLARLGLVDEYRLIVHPVLLGRGTPMFQGIESRQKLRLTRTTQLGRSLVVLCYEPIPS